jgi:hypothetical protein
LNSRNVAQLASLMTNDHLFLNAKLMRHQQPEQALAVWSFYFNHFQDCRCELIAKAGISDAILAYGQVSCSRSIKNGTMKRSLYQVAVKAVITSGLVNDAVFHR